jgi:hypothetical protein
VALVLALVLGLLGWRERFGKVVVIASGLLLAAALGVGAVFAFVVTPDQRAKWKTEAMREQERMEKPKAGEEQKNQNRASPHLTYKPEHAETFKGRVVYDPMTHGGTTFAGDAQEERAKQACAFSNTIEYQITD